jgi:hypothetical protein
MSIAIIIGVHDGVVLAADSASTLTFASAPGVVIQPGQQVVGNVYDNANKIFNLVKGQPIGCITFGSGNIGNASIGTLIKDLRKKLTDTPREMNFDVEHYTMQGVSQILAKFLGDQCDELDQPTKLNTNMGFLLGGYSKPGDLGESWSVEIQKGVPQPPKKLRADHEVGLSWGGMTEVIQRIIVGFSPQMFPILAAVSQPPQNPAVLASQLGPVLTAQLQAPLVFAPMPIQDVIDLARFLVHAAIMFSRFSPGPNMVGGPIEIAAITKHENFKWISRKHYYDQPLNKEPIHVVIDK